MMEGDDANDVGLQETIELLMAAAEAAKSSPGQDMLVRLIEAVLLYAGRELASNENRSYADGKAAETI